MSAPGIATYRPTLTAQGEREVSRVLAKILATRYPGTRWSTDWVPALADRRAA